VEYLRDVKALVFYLGEKIGVGTTCIYCDKTFRSFEGVQSHMENLCHCKLPNDSDEFDEFYDFTESYSGILSELDIPHVSSNSNEKQDQMKESEVEEIILEQIQKKKGIKLSEDGLGLILPSGRTIGHRSLARYYMQNFTRPLSEIKMAEIANESNGKKLIGWTGNKVLSNQLLALTSGSSNNDDQINETDVNMIRLQHRQKQLANLEGADSSIVMSRKEMEVEVKRLEKSNKKEKDKRRERHQKWLKHQSALGIKHNRLQCHYRDPNRLF